MKQIETVRIPQRHNIPETSLYAEVHTQNSEFGKRDTLMMIPGGPGNDHSLYDSEEYSITRALLPFVDIILFDPRGCGRSKKSDAKYCTLDEYVEDIEAIRKHFTISSNKLIIFGQSYGSIAAIAYAIKYNENIKKLFLIGGVSNGNFLKEAIDDLLERGTPEQKCYAKIIWDGAFTDSLEEVADYYETMGPLYSYLFKPGGVAPSIDYNVDVLNLGFGHFLKNFDFRQKLSKITCPVLILWGENEWIISKKQVYSVHQGIPNSKLITYQKCGHMLWLDQWDRFLSDAKKFLIN